MRQLVIPIARYNRRM